MKKLTAALIVGTTLWAGCSFRSSRGPTHSVAYTERHTSGNEADLGEGVRRINAFRQELLARGLRVTSTSTTNSSEQVTLTGNYGKLRDLEVTLWTSGALEIQMNESHLGASAHAELGSKEEEDEFEVLKQRLRSVVNDMK